MAIVLLLVSGCAAQQVQRRSQTSPSVQQEVVSTADVPQSEVPEIIVTEPAAAEKIQIAIKNFVFNPSTTEISKGTTVAWTNEDSAPHTITSVNGEEINSNTLSKGQTYSHTFNAEGEYEYYCKIHPNMKGKIVVK